MSRSEITSETKVARLLDSYPELEPALMEMAPEFKKLKNPVLRKTIARVTSLRQAATVAGLSAHDLVNRLRVMAGMPPMELPDNLEAELMGELPPWLVGKPVAATYDASEEIRSGKMPLSNILQQLESLSSQEVLLLITPLLPAPLLEKVREKDYRTWTEKMGTQIYHSYILKK
jgi:hypothetical protein